MKHGFTIETLRAQPDSPMTVPSLCELSSANSSFLDDSVNVSVDSYDNNVAKKSCEDDSTGVAEDSMPQDKKGGMIHSEGNGPNHTRINSLHSIGDLPPLSIPSRPKLCAEVPKERTNPQLTMDSKDATSKKQNDVSIYPPKSKLVVGKKPALTKNEKDKKTQEKQKSNDETIPSADTEAESRRTEECYAKESSLLVPTLDADGCKTNTGEIASELIEKLKELRKKEKQTSEHNQNDDNTTHPGGSENDTKYNTVTRGRAYDVSRCTNSSLEARLQQSIEREIQQTNEVDRLLGEIKQNRIALEKEAQAKKMLQSEVDCLYQLSSSQQETISSQQKAIESYEKQLILLKARMYTKADDEHSSCDTEDGKCDETKPTKEKLGEEAKLCERSAEVEKNESLMLEKFDNAMSESDLFAEQLVESENIINNLKNALEDKEQENDLLKNELLETKEKLNDFETRSNSFSVLQSNISKLETITNQNAAAESFSKINTFTKKEKDEMESKFRNRIQELEIKISRMGKVNVAQELQLSGKNSEIQKLKVSHISEVTLLDHDREALTNRLEEKDKELAKLKDRLRSYNVASSSLGSGGDNERSPPTEWGGNVNVGDKDEWKRAVSKSVNASVNFLNGLGVAANMAQCSQPH